MPNDPNRQKTDANMQAIDLQWFHEFRREIKEDFKDLRADMTAIHVSMQNSLQDQRFTVTKHGEQIESVARDLNRTNQHLDAVDGRVNVLERKAGDESAINRAVNQGWFAKISDGIASQVGTATVVAIGMVLYWILSHYFKGTDP